LRARFLYLCKNMIAASGSRAYLQMVQSNVEFQTLLSYIADRDSQLNNRLTSVFDFPEECLVSSSRIGGDLFRLPHTAGMWSTGEDARGTFRAAARGSGLAGDGPVEAVLAPHQHVLLASPLIPLQKGDARSAAQVWAGQGNDLVHEFIYFDVPLFDDGAGVVSSYDGLSLAAVIVIHAGNPAVSDTVPCVIFPVPSVCERRDGTYHLHSKRQAFVKSRVFVRCNGLNIFATARAVCHKLKPGLREPAHLQVFVIGWKPM
jgi:hypothetical protein